VKPAKDLLLRCGSTEYRCFAWLPTNTIYCPLAHPNPIVCLVHRAKRLVQPTTRRGWANAMIFCVAVPLAGTLSYDHIQGLGIGVIRRNDE
jgi:hypothetical protein